MEQPISRKQHGIADYGYIPLVAAAPSLVGFENEPTATRLARIISGGVLVTSLLTRYEWGLWKVIPFRAHLAADAAVSAFSLAAPCFSALRTTNEPATLFSPSARSARLWASCRSRKRCNEDAHCT